MQLSLKQYLKELEKRYQAHFNVEINKIIAGKQCDICAISIIEHFRHILTKKIQIDQYQENEMILVKGSEHFVQYEEVKDFSQYLIMATSEFVKPSLNVMSHTINGILVSSEGFSSEAVEAARKFRYGKTFCLGLKGWCDIRLLLLDIKNHLVYYNLKGREVAEIYAFKKKTGGDQKQAIKM